MYREFGVRAERESFTKWDSPLLVDYEHVFKDAGYKSAWQWLRERDWLWATFVAVPGAIGAIQQLRSQGHYLECLTAKPEWAEWCVWRWLGRWRPAFNRVTIVTNKTHKANASDADLLIDDKDENVKGWVMSRRERIGIVFDQPWNRAPAVEGNVRTYRAHDWSDVHQLVEHINWRKAVV